MVENFEPNFTDFLPTQELDSTFIAWN